MYELIVIGGGPAGLAAAVKAYECGLRRILIIERDRELGGILNQCIHNGFGLHRFGEELTGPEYAARFIAMLDGTTIEVSLDTMVLSVTSEKEVCCVSPEHGYQVLKAKSVILCMGCRERPRGAIGTPGTRPAGIFTAGAAQRYVNIEGKMIGRRIVILGSGDIGLIMARRMTLEGAKVLACVEVMPYSSGLQRNITQCLEDYDIPLYLSSTVIEIKGEKRVEQVVTAKVDEHRNPIPGTEMTFDCDTLLLSVGLIPENELTQSAGIEMDRGTNGAIVCENMETSIPGIFACGNVLHVHDLVDYVSEESELAGRSAAEYVLNGESDCSIAEIAAREGVSAIVPQRIRIGAAEDNIKISFRPRRVFKNAAVTVESGDELITSSKRSHLAPGEMSSVIIPKKRLEALQDKLVISVKEEQL